MSRTLLKMIYEVNLRRENPIFSYYHEKLLSKNTFEVYHLFLTPMANPYIFVAIAGFHGIADIFFEIN